MIMRKVILNAIVLSFYAIGLLQAIHRWHFILSIFVGVAAALFADYIDKNKK